MNPETDLMTPPAISTLIEDDPFFARMREFNLSIVRRAYQLFNEIEFRDVHDFEVWQTAVSEMLIEVPLTAAETDDGITVYAAVPGFTEKEIELKVDSDHLFITGKQESLAGNGETANSERKSKEFICEYLLLAEIEPEKVTAELNGGVLEIHLTKCGRSAKLLASGVAA